MVTWVPEIVDEDLIISEPWEDIITLNVFTYTGSGGTVSGGAATTSSEEPPLFFSVYSENSNAYMTLQLEGWATDSIGASYLYTFPTDIHAVNIYGGFYMDAP
jgi:hypothetical protein